MKRNYQTTAYAVMVEYINSKPDHTKITRRELKNAVWLAYSTGQCKGSDIDHYRRLLTALGYLVHEQSGVYRKKRYVDISSTHQLRQRYDRTPKFVREGTSLVYKETQPQPGIDY